MKSLLLLPTFDRPELFKRFLDSYVATKATIPSIAIVDLEDPALAEYKAIKMPETWELVLTHSRKMGPKVRECWDRFKDLDSVCILNDDHVCITEEWDKKTLAHVDGKNFVTTSDRWMAPMRAAGVTAFSMPLVKSWGFQLFPNGVNHLFIDNVWEAIGKNTGCWWVEMSVIIEHRHVLKRESPLDKTHQSVYTNNWQSGPDRQAFEKFMKDELPDVIKRTKEFLNANHD